MKGLVSMRKGRFPVCLLMAVTFWISFVPAAARAERHAVLIGIGDFQDRVHLPALRGPANDIRALKDQLAGRYGFPEKNITTLVNEAASKKNIMSALSRLRSATKPGDFIFIYYSGHGTSGLDPYAGLPIGDATGAVIPYDFIYNAGNLQGMLSGLVIGKRDLRPILSALDQDRKLLVVFDACFSGNSVRCAFATGPVRQVSLPLSQCSMKTRGVGSEPYPYKNVVYISAAGEAEPARDLLYGAYDGKPHGALTDALLRGLEGSADTNHDGMITYEELYQFAKKGAQKYGHTPQVLHRASLESPVFDSDTTIPEKKKDDGENHSQKPPETLSLKIDGGNAELLLQKMRSVPGVHVTEGDYDFLVKEEGKGYGFYLSGGESLCSVGSVEEALSVVTKHARARELLRLVNPKQRFNVWLRAGNDDGRSVFQEGESLNFSIRSEEDADLLLLDIDSHGTVCVLLPENAPSSTRISKGETLRTRDIGVVEPPMGVDFLKVFAFKQKVSGLSKFATRDGMLDPTSKAFSELLDIIWTLDKAIAYPNATNLVSSVAIGLFDGVRVLVASGGALRPPF